MLMKRGQQMSRTTLTGHIIITIAVILWLISIILNGRIMNLAYIENLMASGSDEVFAPSAAVRKQAATKKLIEAGGDINGSEVIKAETLGVIKKCNRPISINALGELLNVSSDAARARIKRLTLCDLLDCEQIPVEVLCSGTIIMRDVNHYTVKEIPIVKVRSKQQEVLDAIKSMGESCVSEISRHINFNRSGTQARITRMVKARLLSERLITVDRANRHGLSKVPVIHYSIVEVSQ